jgi:NADH-quinone oxidoreductase subunit M
MPNNIINTTAHLNILPNFLEYCLLDVFFLPLISLIIIYIAKPLSEITLYNISLGLSIVSFIFSLFLWFSMDEVLGGFQATYSFNIIPSFHFPLHLGADSISIFFVLLTNFFIYLCILSLKVTTPKLSEALIYLFFLQWSVIGSFLFLDLLGFFLFFEITLIPIYFLVLIWGSRERRIRASYLISIYTLLGSIFIFFNLLYLYSKTGTTEYVLLQTVQFNELDQHFLWITFFIAFAAKIPVFPLHIWLPEAHVEAPTLGSVILAVLLLKLGTYGLIRFSLPLFPEGTLYFTPIISTFAILGIVYTCLTAIRQIDLKKIIAYSSVGHMNIVLLGILAGNMEALQGAIFQMLSHGVVSGALFFCVGSLYERYAVRSLNYFGGLNTMYPLLSITFLIFSLANISFPLTSSFVGEFLILMGLFIHNFWSTFFASTGMVLGAVYTLWTYNRVFYGNVRSLSLTLYVDLTRKELALFSSLIFVLLVMGIAPSIFLNTLFIDSINLLEHAKAVRTFDAQETVMVLFLIENRELKSFRFKHHIEGLRNIIEDKNALAAFCVANCVGPLERHEFRSSCFSEENLIITSLTKTMVRFLFSNDKWKNMRSILEGKIYLIRNFEKEKLNNLIINNKLTLRIFLQKQSLYRKEHLKYLLSGINSSGGEITMKKSTVLLCNSLVHSRGSFLSRLNTKFINDGTPPGRRRMSSRRVLGRGAIPSAINTSPPNPEDAANVENLTHGPYPSLPASPAREVERPGNGSPYWGEESPSSEERLRSDSTSSSLTSEGELESTSSSLTPRPEDWLRADSTSSSMTSEGELESTSPYPIPPYPPHPSITSNVQNLTRAQYPKLPRTKAEERVVEEPQPTNTLEQDNWTVLPTPISPFAAELMSRGAGSLATTVRTVWEWFTG